MEAREKVKVFFFVPNLDHGGDQRQVVETIRALPPRFEPVLCVGRNGAHEDLRLPDDQPRHVLGVDRLDLGAFSKLVALLREEQPQILHSFRDDTSLWARLAAFAAHVPVVVASCRRRLFAPRQLLAEALMLRRGNTVVTASPSVREGLLGLTRVPAERVQLFPDLVDLEHFRPPTGAERRDARGRWRIGENERLLVMPGRLALHKHQVGLLLALRDAVRDRRIPPSTRVILAGRRGEDWYDRLVISLLADPELREVVRYVGPQQDIRALYWAADALLLPSLWEGAADVLAEGCACALPALVSEAADVEGLIHDGQDGVRVPTARRDALVDGLAWLSTRPRRVLAELGANARATVEARQSGSREPSYATATLYEQLLAAAPRHPALPALPA